MSSIVYISELSRFFIFFTLLMAALGKSNTFDQFKQNLVESFKVAQRWSGTFAVIIISVEWLLAILILLDGFLANIAMFVAMLLFIIFTLIIAVVLVQDKIISCNCFGQKDSKITAFDLLRNALLITACAYYSFYQQNDQSLDITSYFLLAGLSLILFQITINLRYIGFLLSYGNK